MRPAVLTLVLAIAAPVFAQAGPPIDWTKPVVGVDAPMPAPKHSNTASVEVFTLDQLRSAESPGVEEFVKSVSKPAPPPCESPPTARTPANKPGGPSPCPATR